MRARGRAGICLNGVFMSYTPHEIFQRSTAPVTVDEDKCIADKGCTVCVDVCPLDLLAIDLSKGKAFMKFENAGTACRANRIVRPVRSRSRFLICCADAASRFAADHLSTRG